MGYSTTGEQPAAVAKLLSLPFFTSVQDQCKLCHCLNMQWEGYASQTGTEKCEVASRYLSNTRFIQRIYHSILCVVLWSLQFLALHSILCRFRNADLTVKNVTHLWPSSYNVLTEANAVFLLFICEFRLLVYPAQFLYQPSNPFPPQEDSQTGRRCVMLRGQRMRDVFSSSHLYLYILSVFLLASEKFHITFECRS